ncbi:MAG TPA: MFS transporter [Candidatus Binataceae bacterium]|nr:MFS transporter [Candidatus Binataceae bacterium]
MSTPAERAAITAGHIEADSALAAALAKVRRNLLPFLFVLYIIAYMDRINVGFASLQMNRDAGLSDAVFGLGAGLFFVGYFIFEIPSNLILARVGARVWIARIMITWGMVAIAMMFVRGAASFYTLRFLLGAAEAGFFPGVILYLSWWFPEREQARAIALFMTATAIAGIVVGPVSGALLMMHGVFGIKGWQWLFAMEGVPAILMGIAVVFWLPDGPDDARWLSMDERRELSDTLAAERAARARQTHHSLGAGLSDWRVWLLAAIYFGMVMGFYGVSLWLPQIVKGMNPGGDFTIGVISAIPSLAAALCMVQVGRLSDRTGERRLIVALALFAGASGLLLSALTRNPIVELAAIALSSAGISSALGPFWAIPNVFLGGAAAAGGIALINSLGNLGGFAGPTLMGYMKQATGTFAGGLGALSFALAAAGALALLLPRSRPA